MVGIIYAKSIGKGAKGPRRDANGHPMCKFGFPFTERDIDAIMNTPCWWWASYESPSPKGTGYERYECMSFGNLSLRDTLVTKTSGNHLMICELWVGDPSLPVSSNLSEKSQWIEATRGRYLALTYVQKNQITIAYLDSINFLHR